jgi:hypothetical protein
MHMNAKTLMHYFTLLANAADVTMTSDMRAELQDALDEHDQQIEQLQTEVRELRSLVTPVTR